MPLLDHFRSSWSQDRPWESFHGAWATGIAGRLNETMLPADYYALPLVRGGQVEIDVAACREENGQGTAGSGPATAVWAPPRPQQAAFIDFANLDAFEVHVYQRLGGPQLRAAIELVSPANKDRPSHRRAFAAKCAAYLQRGVSLIAIDLVTERLANLHDELIVLLGADELAWQSPTQFSAIAYRVLETAGRQQLEVWREPLALGQPLPGLPLWLDIDFALPLPLEETYLATCRLLRIPPAS